MAGTKAGAAKARQVMIEKYGEDYFKRIGVLGAKAYNERNEQGIAKPRGFAVNRELAKIVGAKGGRKTNETYIPVETQAQ